MHDPARGITVTTLAQWSQGQDWRLHLVQDVPYHRLIWITRGQGLALLDGTRRGVGAHNLLLAPAGSLHMLQLGRQSMGHIVSLPVGTDLRLPQIPRHLRIRDAEHQGALTSFIENVAREEHVKAPLYHEAIEAQAGLMSIWLRRQIMQEEHVPPKTNAAARLSARYCAQVSAQYSQGRTMADFAAALSVTPTHLSRAVRAATGKTAAAVLTERLLFAARTLLAETTEPAQNIARHLGFGSAAYFTRFMQKHTGAPPSKLRKRLGQ